MSDGEGWGLGLGGRFKPGIVISYNIGVIYLGEDLGLVEDSLKLVFKIFFEVLHAQFNLFDGVDMVV